MQASSKSAGSWHPLENWWLRLLDNSFGFLFKVKHQNFCVPVLWLLELQSIFIWGASCREQMRASPLSFSKAGGGNCSVPDKKNLDWSVCIWGILQITPAQGSSRGWNFQSPAALQVWLPILVGQDEKIPCSLSCALRPSTCRCQIKPSSLFSSLLREGVPLHRNSCGHFALLAGRLFDSGIRIWFLQGVGSKWCEQVNTAGSSFPTVFSQSTCSDSSVCDLLLGLFTSAASLLSWHSFAPLEWV